MRNLPFIQRKQNHRERGRWAHISQKPHRSEISTLQLYRVAVTQTRRAARHLVQARDLSRSNLVVVRAGSIDTSLVTVWMEVAWRSANLDSLFYQKSIYLSSASRSAGPATTRHRSVPGSLRSPTRAVRAAACAEASGYLVRVRVRGRVRVRVRVRGWG